MVTYVKDTSAEPVKAFQTPKQDNPCRFVQKISLMEQQKGDGNFLKDRILTWFAASWYVGLAATSIRIFLDRIIQVTHYQE
nr:hypothetical protein [Tanacetum cinerariifolium]